MCKIFIATLGLACLLNFTCHAEWRPSFEVAADLDSDDPIIREAANGEFGVSTFQISERNYTSLTARNDKLDRVIISTTWGYWYQVTRKYSYFPHAGYHHWIVFLDENREFLTEFQWPDCRELQWVNFTEPVFKAIKYFYVEERFVHCCPQHLFEVST